MFEGLEWTLNGGRELAQLMEGLEDIDVVHRTRYPISIHRYLYPFTVPLEGITVLNRV